MWKLREICRIREKRGILMKDRLFIKNITFSLLMILVIFGVTETGYAETVKSFDATPGVSYKSEKFNYNNRLQESNVLQMDLNNPHVEVEPGISSPLTDLEPTSSQAKYNTYNQHHIVGAMNASFFHFDSGLPAYLLAKNNKVSTLGVISTGFDEYMSIPTAFGVSSGGKAIIDRFQYDSSFSINNRSYEISSINRARSADEIILYSPHFSYSSTRTNSYGSEIVVTGINQSIDTGSEFGKPITGVVQSVTGYGKGNSTIPNDGYVISIQGGAKSADLSGVKAGDPITLTLDVTEPWKNSKFILASGPMLVKNGRVDMTISPTSPRATSRNPRSAVATNQDGSKVYFVTVDGRQSGYSEGMTLNEFAQYLVSVGAYNALNLDGGGSTTMAVRNPGYIYPTVVNSPSSGYERSVSAILQAVSTAPYTQGSYIEGSLEGASKLLIGGTVKAVPKYVLDESYHKLTMDPSKLTYSVEGDIGRMDGSTFIAERAGAGNIVIRYENAIKKLPIEVLVRPDHIQLNKSKVTVPAGQKEQFSLKAYDKEGALLQIPAGSVKWSVSDETGRITENGLFTASTQPSQGVVTANLNNTIVQSTVNVVADPIQLNGFEVLNGWSLDKVRAEGTISLSSNMEPRYSGNTSLKIDYRFDTGVSGTAAVYIENESVSLSAAPNYLGIWVYGDGKRHWLRGKVSSSDGTEYTVNFTEEGELDWKGWKYVRAAVPTSIKDSLKVKSIYLVEPLETKKNNGTIYLDNLQAEYSDDYKEPLLRDIPNNYWAREEIRYLMDKGFITGYSDGFFRPETYLSREHAAVLLTRVLNLSLTNIENPGYSDVTEESLYYKEISVVADSGIMTGKENGKYFDPKGNLTRAQMAAILTRAYQLSGSINPPFNDVPDDYWAYKEIHALAASGITTGYPDHTYKPNEFVKRAQYSAFLYRILIR
jgi:hypothetical protein